MYTPVAESDIVVVVVEVSVAVSVVAVPDTCGQLVSAQNYSQLVVVVSVSTIRGRTT